MPDEQLVAVIGTTHPTSAQVRELLIDDRERWVGTYIVSYCDDEPHETHLSGTPAADLFVVAQEASGEQERLGLSGGVVREGIGDECLDGVHVVRL